MAEKIRAIMIFEIMGKPAEFIKESLIGIMDKLAKEKGITVINRKIQEPKKLEDAEIFTTFSEAELEVDSIQRMIILMFQYMPAHIEIISPNEVKIKNFDLCSVCNDLMARLHAYDDMAKTVLFEKNNLVRQMQELAQQGKIQLPKERPQEKKAKKVKKKKK